jgi:hypothetical protein
MEEQQQRRQLPENHKELVAKGWKQIEEDRIALEKDIEKLEIRIRSSITCSRSPARHWAIRTRVGVSRRIGKTRLLKTLAIKLLMEERAYSVYVLTTCKRKFLQDFGDIPDVWYMGDENDTTWQERPSPQDTKEPIDTGKRVFLIDNANYVDPKRLAASRECARTSPSCFCVEFFNEQDGIPPPEGSFVVDMPQNTKTHGDYFPHLADYPNMIQQIYLYDSKSDALSGRLLE